MTQSNVPTGAEPAFLDIPRESRAPGWNERAAVLVLFEREVDLPATVQQLSGVARRLVLVDNSPDAILLRSNLQSAPGTEVSILHNGNRGGLAGAYNAALTQLAMADQPVSEVVFADDDSDGRALDAFLRDADTQALLRRPDTAAVAPAYRDRATGMRAAYIQLGHWRFRHLSRAITGVHSVAFLINSMSVWRREAIDAIGAFDERLGVDHIDTDYCLRARQRGLKLFVNGSHDFAHAIGNRRTYRFMGRTLQSGGHGAARRRSIARNTAVLMCRHGRSEPAFAALCLSRLVYEAVGIVMVEDQKARKLGALVAGALEGVLRSGATVDHVRRSALR